MRVTKLYFGSQEFMLANDVDVGALKERLLEASSGGAAFVDFDAVTRGSVSLLISGSVAVRVESRILAVDEDDGSPPAAYGSFDEQQLVFDEFEF